MSSMAPEATVQRMIIERAMTQDWLSNTYLVAAADGGDALLIDAGGPMDELIAKADEHGLTVTHVLLTHHHGDHVADLGKALERWPDAEVLIHPGEREHVMGATGDLDPDAQHELRGPQALGHGRAAPASARDDDPARPHGSDDGRRGARAQPLRARLARC